ncbi:MAG: error-prone DNA polymerase [Chloroflexi bacterium]|nr:error-prone DNA polymerase [Chloroflexota bacterium]
MTDYVELHCHSNFSLLDGASHPEELVAQAAALEMPALALTDHDAVYGATRFVEAAQAAGVRPILGAEMTLEDGAHLTLLVEDETGWHNLCALISAARLCAPKGEARLPDAALREHTAGLIALSGCRQGRIPRALASGDWDEAVREAWELRDLFGPERGWIELQHHLLSGDDARIAGLVALAEAAGLGCVATNNVHYATRDRHRLGDILVCIRHNTALEGSAHLRRPNSEYYLKPAAKMRRLFARYPDAVANTVRIAERCQFEPRYGLQDLPAYDIPAGLDARAYLRRLCAAALRERYPGAPAAAERRLETELGVIERAGLANYFLIVWDIVRFAREHGIRCQGRGSAANSLVAYLLGITPIDPLAHNLVFERFLSDERRIAPDIDIDFQADRREEVIQYIYGRYGHDHAAMACTFVTYRARSAIRDVGKALGLPPHLLDEAARSMDFRRDAASQAEGLRETLGSRWSSDVWAQFATLCQQIRGFPRHLGIHNGGMVITGTPLAGRVPVEPATMPDRYVVQWDKEGLETAGLVKIDILGLRMLSLIAEAARAVEVRTGAAVDLSRLAFDDPAIYELISRADTIGVFQVESRAQAQMQPIFQPRRFEDLIVAISLIRPGPIQGDMVHPYLRRRLGEEPVTYAHPSLEAALGETLGVVLFQEQVLQVTRQMAGFSPGQGELLRRALGSKNAGEAIESFHEAFVQGAQARGVTRPVAEEVFDRLRAFAGYSFPKSHAAAFAVLVYQSAWLKVYHPAPFFAALLNHQPMGFWSPAVVVGDARRHGIRVLPVDIHRSEGVCMAVEDGLRLGFNYVKGLGEASIARLADARLAGPFTGLGDFCRRTRLPPRLVEHLILAGAFDGWDVPRRRLLWELGKLRYQADELELAFSDDGVQLLELSEVERFALERSLLGVSMDGHVMEYYRAWLDARGVLSSAAVRERQNGAPVRVAGLVVMHQAPPTAKGVHFVSLEDEHGLLDVIVWPDVYERTRRVLHGASLLLVEGVVQRRESVMNVIAERVGMLDVPSGA